MNDKRRSERHLRRFIGKLGGLPKIASAEVEQVDSDGVARIVLHTRHVGVQWVISIPVELAIAKRVLRKKLTFRYREGKQRKAS